MGKDTAEILEYSNTRKALATHVDEDDSLKQGLIDSMGRQQDTILINESVLYSLILSSKLPKVRQFKRWLHVDKENKGVRISLTPGGKQQVPIINESGLYALSLCCFV